MRWRDGAGLVLTVVAAGCSPRAPGGAAAPSPSPSPARAAAVATAVPIHVETRGGNGEYVTIVETAHGRKMYTIRALAGNMQRSGTNEATGELEQPHITFNDKAGSTTVADAPKAHIAERDKTVVMTGGVRANTSGGSVLTCDTLTYYGTTERFRGEGHVRLTAPNGLALDGRHLDGDVRLQDVNVTGTAQ